MIDSFLKKIAEVQIKHAPLILLAGTALTALLATGIPNIQLQTDFQEGLPDDLEPIQAEEKVESEFRSSSSILVVFELEDDTLESGDIKDMRDPEMLESMRFLENRLEERTLVDSVTSPAPPRGEIPGSIENVSVEGSESLYSRDYTAAQMLVQLNEEMTEENIREAESLIRNEIDDYPDPAGVQTVVSGNPVIRTDIGEILVSDSSRTILSASALILGLLTVTRGLKYGPITFIPLFAGLICTLGAMGWFGIPLTIATVALGAMILGLGVEYGSFITERIVEESEEQSVEDAVRTTIPETGFAVVGSSMTTVIGFSALLLASISFIRNLGLTLSLGIILTVSSALIMTPSLILTLERWRQWR